jgi:hypothetical protein
MTPLSLGLIAAAAAVTVNAVNKERATKFTRAEARFQEGVRRAEEMAHDYDPYSSRFGDVQTVIGWATDQYLDAAAAKDVDAMNRAAKFLEDNLQALYNAWR